MKKMKMIRILSCALLGAAAMAASTECAQATEAQSVQQGETVIADGVYIGNVNVGGMNEAQARSAVEEYVAGLLDTTFTLSGENGSIELTAEEMGVTADTDTAVEAAINVGRAGSLINRYKETQDLETESLVLDMNLSVDKQKTAQLLYSHSSELSIEAVDNSLVRENGTFRFVEGSEGVEVDIVESVYVINDFLANGWDGSDNEITLVSEVVEPRGTEEELSTVQDLLGSFSTDFSSSSSGRAKNVETGCSKINGTILYPGEELEFRSAVSPFTQENGYELAGAYENGTVVESFGGGICQVATTLYNAAIRAELDITMRYNHSMTVSYVEPSMDAAIAGDYKDLHFVNNYDTPIYIEGYCSGGVLYFNIYGQETRSSNRTISFESETLSTDEEEIQFNLDSSQAVGYWNVEQSAHIGSTARLWKIVTVDGVEESREVFNTSTYQSSPKIITIGTKGLTEKQLAVLKEAVETGDESTVRSTISSLQEEDEEEETEEESETEEDSEKSSNKSDSKKSDKSDSKSDTNSNKNDNSKTDSSESSESGDAGDSSVDDSTDADTSDSE